MNNHFLSFKGGGSDFDDGNGNRPGSSNQDQTAPRKKYKPHRSMTRYGHYQDPQTDKQFDAPSPDLEDHWVNAYYDD